MKTVLITAAIPEELGQVKKKIKKKSSFLIGGYRACQGVLFGINTLILQTGVGAKNAKQAVEGTLCRYNISQVLSVGFAGAVDNRLLIGDIVLCNPVKDIKKKEKDRHLSLEDDEIRLFSSLFKDVETPFYSGPALTVDKIISTVKKKKELRERYNVLAVEMENSAIAEVASLKNIPTVMIRAISDTADDDISFLDPFSGNPSKREIALYALSHPDIIPRLNRLRKNSKKAAQSITLFVEKIYKELFSRQSYLQKII